MDGGSKTILKRVVSRKGGKHIYTNWHVLSCRSANRIDYFAKHISYGGKSKGGREKLS